MQLLLLVGQPQLPTAGHSYQSVNPPPPNMAPTAISSQKSHQVGPPIKGPQGPQIHTPPRPRLIPKCKVMLHATPWLQTLWIDAQDGQQNS